MTPLDRQLIRRIDREGALPVSAWMATVLHDPAHGYYATRDPLGARGDFTTAPEISQMFGEILGLWFADLWLRAGSPGRVLLVELGPGRGTLMADMLRTLTRIPGARAAIEPHLVEISPALTQVQRRTLTRTGEGPAPAWHAGLDTVPDDAPLFLVANEFFDALPIRQWVRRADGWRERRVGIVRAAESAGAPQLAFEDGPAVPPPDLAPHALAPGTAPPIGAVVERSPAAREVTAAIARRIGRQGGAALIVDYGYWESPFADTLQAMRAHRPHPPLSDCGEADLTAYVDFAALAATARSDGVAVWGPVEQGLFLARNGIEARARQLQPRDPGVPAALARLIRADQMGTLFKVLAITGADIAIPGGFDAGDRRL